MYWSPSMVSYIHGNHSASCSDEKPIITVLVNIDTATIHHSTLYHTPISQDLEEIHIMTRLLAWLKALQQIPSLQTLLWDVCCNVIVLSAIYYTDHIYSSLLNELGASRSRKTWSKTAASSYDKIATVLTCISCITII